MSKRSRVRSVVLLLVVVWMVAPGQSLQSILQQKLHPAFQALVAGSVPTSLSKVVGVSGPASVATVGGLPVYDAIITTTDASALRASGIHLNSVVGRYATARVTVQDLVRLAERSEVVYLDPGATDHPALDLSVPETGANLLHGGFINNTPYTGKGVIVLIYDTGIDWRHFDFRDPVDTTKSRILAIWDQTLVPRSGERNPTGFSYGVEYTKAQIENELDGTPANFVRERDIEGHGTHVAGIASGNGSSYVQKYVGMAPEADIVVVKGGDNSFSESSEIDALSYAQSKASEFNEPVAMNMSVGGQSGSHDGTRPSETAVNSFVQTAGRVVAISAGNDGDEIIHTSGQISSGGSPTITVSVPSYTPAAGTNNDKFTLEIWFDSPLAVNASVKTPAGHVYQSGTSTTEGTISFTNSSFTPNGNRSVTITVSDQSSSTPAVGDWTITLSGTNQTASYNAWLTSWTVGDNSASIVNGDNQRTVAMPGTAQDAITVGSYVTKNSWTSYDGSGWSYSGSPSLGSISSFSSVGPTGDGRQKPDLVAPGQGIASALSSSADTNAIGGTWIVPSKKYFISQGTSMAAPHVTGASALLLQISRNLTSAQVKSLLTASAISDAATGSVPNITWGYGKMDVLGAAVREINPQAVVQRQTLAYDNAGSNQILKPYLAGSKASGALGYAVRFSPAISGKVTAIQVNVTTSGNNPIQGAGPLLCEVWTNASGSVGGIPGTKLGNTVSYAFARLSPGTNNSIDMTGSNVSVVAGQEYHVVLSLSNPTDLLLVRTDAVQPVTNRSSTYDGSKWLNLVDPSSSMPQVNLRVRAVVTSISGLVAVERSSSVPDRFALMQNYPNPFNPSTTIRYTVPTQGRIRLRIFDLIGREVASLVDEVESAGTYVVEWQGRDNLGHQLASGVYFCRLEGGGQTLTQKMMLMK